MTIWLPIVLMLILFICGMPVAFAMGIAGAVGLFLHNGLATMMGILEIVPNRTVASFLMTTVPMFILMAEFASASKLTQKMFFAASKWLGHLPGGLGIATVMAGATFGAISGSSTAAAAAFAPVAIPEMKKYGYNEGFAAGIVAVTGTLAILIPPSIAFILYGIIAEVSIGKLFIAGIIPGLVSATAYSFVIYLRIKIKPNLAPRISRSTFREKINSLIPLWAITILIILVLGGIYSGAITATEAGAVGAMGAFIIAVVGKIDRAAIWSSLGRTARATCMIFTIIIGAMIFGYFVTTTQLNQKLINWIIGNNFSPNTVLFVIICLYLVLGCFMDQIAILLTTLPLVFPLILSLGFDPIWFGVIVVKTGEIGLATPPFGMNTYVTSSCSGVPLEEVFRGEMVLIMTDLFVLLLLCLFPQICLWLPNLMST